MNAVFMLETPFSVAVAGAEWAISAVVASVRVGVDLGMVQSVQLWCVGKA